MITTYRGGTVRFPIYFADEQGKARDLIGPAEYFEWRVMANEGANYTQVYPVAGWQLGDLLLDREGLGEYLVYFTAAAAAVLGQYLLEVRAVGIREYQWKVRFEVVDKEVPSLFRYTHLALLRDFRERGLAVTVLDYRIAMELQRASEYVERYCGRVFSSWKRSMILETDEAGVLRFPSPCCWLQSIKDPKGTELVLSEMKLYSRALRSETGSPSFGEDDRDNSRVEYGWIGKRTRYTVTGVFGYTDPDGSEVGMTPDGIQWAVIQTGFTYLANAVGGSSPLPLDRIIEEKTATQSYKLSDNPEWASQVTAGDTEIARVLNQYRRPMQVGAI